MVVLLCSEFFILKLILNIVVYQFEFCELPKDQEIALQRLSVVGLRHNFVVYVLHFSVFV